MNADVSDDGTATAGEASNDAAAERAVLDTSSYRSRRFA
jgi:hypothetical protein